MLPSARICSGKNPCFSRVFKSSASRISFFVPFLHPIPTYSFLGKRYNTPDFLFLGFLSQITIFPQHPSSCSSLPHMVSSSGTSPKSGNSEKIPVFFFSRIPAEIFFASSRSVMTSPFSMANTSAANFFCTSVAVVITALPPVYSARTFASVTPPPTCPDKSGMANVPFSSRTITGGSVNLSFTNGAIARIAIPAAPINTSACSPQDAPISCFHPSFNLCSLLSSAKRATVYPVHTYPSCFSFSARFNARRLPVPVKL